MAKIKDTAESKGNFAIDSESKAHLLAHTNKHTHEHDTHTQTYTYKIEFMSIILKFFTPFQSKLAFKENIRFCR